MLHVGLKAGRAERWHRVPTSFISSMLVIMTMMGVCSCHTMRQKSATVLTMGPCVAMYTFSFPL